MYFKQLDGIRGVAVLLVILYHWLPSVKIIHNWNFGPNGVLIFFVLSGFLITRILLIEKDKQKGVTTIFKKFYYNRILRIFPIYYLLLFFLFALNFETVRKEILWHFFYGSNILYVLNQKYSNGLSHLWSLSVEEQFYIVWPFFVLLISKTKEKWFFILSIIIGIFFNLLLTNSFVNGSLLMPARVDAFGWGGLLAYIHLRHKDFNATLNKYLFILPFVVLLFIAMNLFSFGKYSTLSSSVFYIICFFFIGKGVVGYKGVLGKFLINRPLIFIGKISYGIYLYHNLMQWLVPYFAKMLGIPFPSQDKEFLRFIIYFVFTIIVSTLSWYIIEKPINTLKKRGVKS